MIHVNRARNNNRQRRLTVRKWKDTMDGIPVFIIGNGPSLNDIDIHLLDDYFTIGLNRVYLKDNFDPTILMWQDLELWLKEKKRIKKLKAIKYCRDASDPERIAYNFKLRGGPFLLASNPIVLHGSGATGPLALELGWNLKCNPFVFLGYDCKYKNGLTDFWGVNKSHQQHTLTKCRKGLQWVHNWHDKGYIKIINCSDNNVFPERVSLPKALEMVKEMCKGDRGEPHNRKYYLNKLFKKSE